MQPYPRSPDLVWLGNLHGTGCLRARAMDTGFPTVAWRLRLGLGCGWVWVSAAPRHSWLGCWGVCVLRACFPCTPPLLAGVCSVAVCAWARVSAAPRHSWLGCWGVCVFVCAFRLFPATLGWGLWCGSLFGLGFWLRPATPGWGVGVCVCWCACSPCTPPLLAGMCGVGVCVWAWVSAAPRQSWLGCWGVRVCVRAPLVPRHSWQGCAAWVCVFGFRFPLRPATHGRGVGVCVCWCSRSAFTPPLLAGVCGLGVGVSARVSAVPRHPWLGCAAWVCVFGLGFLLRPGTPGSGGGVCVCWCACSPCTPPLLAGVCGVGVGVWARVLAAPRHSWLGCWGVRVCVRGPPVPRHSWLGCASWVCVLGLGFLLRPATPGGGVGVCVCWVRAPHCTPPLLAGVCGVGVCVWARVSAAPRHSWLGCWGVRVCVRAILVPRHSWLGCAAWVCVFGFGFRLRPATPGWGVVVCVCWCGRSPCTPPLLAGVCGVGVCVLARVSAAPRHSRLGCAVSGVCVWARVLAATRHSWLRCWGVCVLVFAPRLYPATPGWGVRCGCGCLGSGSGCAPPLLAGVCGVGVCVWAWVSAAPRHSWLGWWAGCVLVCVLPLYPTTPGWGMRCGCVCLGSGFGCNPPLLAEVLGCLCAGVCAPLVPSHSWLGCAVWVWVFGLGFWLRPATPGWGAQRGCVCLGSGLGCAPPLLAGVLWCVCAGVGAPLVPHHSWLGCAVWVCVFWLGFRLRPATPGWGVRCGCVCLGSGFGCNPPLLAEVLGRLCAGVRAPLVPRHSWLGCVVWVWVFGLRFRLRPATPGWGVGVCVFVCVLPLFPATPGWVVRRGCVCLGSGFGCALPLLAGLLGCVCACLRAPLVPRHSWLGCAVWVCVFGLGFWLRPATPGWGVGVCVFVCVLPLYPATPGWGVRRGSVCLGSGFSCAPPLLAGVLGCVCAGVGAPLVHRHSWLRCAVWVWVFGLGFWLRPATPGLDAGVCMLMCLLPLYPATPGWGVRCGCVCLGWGFGCAPPLLAGVLGFVCAGVRAPLVPSHSWLGCAVWVCVFGLWFRLRPATPGWGVAVCVFFCACSACTPPLLAGVCGVGVCAWARVSAAPRHSWLGCWGVSVLVFAPRLYPATPGWGVRCGCWCLGSGFGCAPPLLAGVFGCVCAGVCAPPLPRHSWLGRAAWVCVLGLWFWLRPATPASGVWCVGWLLPGTCSCAVVRSVLCALPRFAAPGGRCGLAPVLVPWLWPAACLSWVPRGPALVRRASSSPVALGAPVGFPVAVVPFPGPGACAPGFTGWLRGARGGRPRTGLIVPAAGPRRGRGAGLAPRRTRSGPSDGVVPGGSLRRRSWAACAAVFCVCGPGH